METIRIEKQENVYWGFAYVRHRSEKKLAERLQNSGILCYVPTVPHAYMMHYTKIITQVPMFPCYVFVCMSREDATDLRYKEKQISRIDLQFDSQKETILISELNALKQCEVLAKNSPVHINPGIQSGDKVLINDGPLSGLVADVVRREDDNNIIIINVTMLNQHLEFPISVEDLKKISEE